jgi:hypothetical protein
MMLRLISLLSNDVAKCVEGAGDKKGLVQDSRQVYTGFEKDIRRTAPRFVPQVQGEGELSEDIRQQLFDDKSAEDNDAASVILSIKVEDCIFLDNMKTHILKYVRVFRLVAHID